MEIIAKLSFSSRKIYCENTIFQLYSRVIIMLCHKDVKLAVFIPGIISVGK